VATISGGFSVRQAHFLRNIAMQLVEIKKLDLVTNTAAIAEGVGRDHDTIIKLVDRNKVTLKSLEVGFEMRPWFKGRQAKAKGSTVKRTANHAVDHLHAKQ
jgi:phage regulator Rha-like protein